MGTPSEPTYDVVVVGGGLAGLAAAATVSRAGGSVAVVESRRLGGRAATSDVDGFRLNPGPHALYRAGPGVATLRRLGVSPAGMAPEVRRVYGLRGGNVHPMPSNTRTLMRSPLLASPAARLELARLLGRTRSRGFDPEPHVGRSLGDWLTEHVGHHDVACLVRTLVRLTTYAGDPDTLDAGAALGQVHLGLSTGVLYLHGGWSRLVDGLAQAAEDRGATVVSGVEVRSIESGRPGVHGGAGWTVVTASAGDGSGSGSDDTPVPDTSREAGDRVYVGRTVVVSAGRPQLAARLLQLGSRWSGLAAQGASVLDVGLAVGRSGSLPRSLVLGVDRPLYGSVHSPPADLAPPGHALVSLLRYHRPGDEHDHEQSRSELTDLVTAMGADPADAVMQRYLHRMVVCSGLPTAEAGGLAGRPSVAVDERPGAFVAGDWVGLYGMLGDAALASGEAAGRAALEAARGTAGTGFDASAPILRTNRRADSGTAWPAVTGSS